MSEIDVTYRPVTAAPQEANLGFTPTSVRPETNFNETLSNLGNSLGEAYGGVKDQALEEAKLNIASNNGQRTEEQKQRPFWSPVSDQDLTNLEVAHGADALKAQNHIDMVNHIDKSPEQYQQHLAEQGKAATDSSQNPEWFAKRFNADSQDLATAQENLHYHYNAEKQVSLMGNLLQLPLVELQQNLMTLPTGTDPSVKEAMQNRALDVIATRLNDPVHSGAAHLALHTLVTKGLASGDPTMYNTVRKMVATGRSPKENLDSIPDIETAKEQYRQTSGNQLEALHRAIQEAQNQRRTADVTMLQKQYAQLLTTTKSTGIELQPYAQSIQDSEFNALNYNEDRAREAEEQQKQEQVHTTISQQEHFLQKAGEAHLDGDTEAEANYTQLAEQSKRAYNNRQGTLNPAVTNAEPYISKYNVDNDKGPALDPLLIKAVIQQESRGTPDAVSSAGATGMMQLMPDTAARFGVTDRKDPEQNIRGGIEYLKFLNKKFHGDLDLILAGYNAGEGRVERAGNTIPNIPETQNYVKDIKANYANLQRNTAVNTHFDTTKESVAETVSMEKYKEDHADEFNALKTGELSTEQILQLSPKLYKDLETGNFPEKAKLKVKAETVRLLASATHKAIASDVATLKTQMVNGDAEGTQKTVQTLLAVANSGHFQYTQEPAVVDALNKGISAVAKDGRVADAVALQEALAKLAPDSNFDDNTKVISQAQADARKPAWISQREKSFQDNLLAIQHALGGPRQITSERDAYAALLPKDQKHILDDVNTADYYSTVLQVPGVDKNRLHQVYTLISGKPPKGKAILTGIPEIDPGTKVPLAAYTNEKWLKGFEAQEQTKDPGFSAENISEETVNRLQAQQGSPQLGTVLENIIALNNRGHVPIAKDPEGIPRLFKLLRPQLTFSDKGIPEISRVQALGSKNAQDYQKLVDQTLLVAAGGGSPVEFIQGRDQTNTFWEKGDYSYPTGKGTQNDPTGWALSNNYVKNLSDGDRGEFMRMWDIGKTINAKPMEQLNLTLRAFEQRSPNFKGIKIRGSLPEGNQSGSVQALSEFLKTDGNGSDDIQKLLTSVPIQNLIKQQRGITTPDNVGLDWTWNVKDDLTLQGFRPGKTPDEVPLEIPKTDWEAGTLRENNAYPDWFAPAVENPQSIGDWVHKTLIAHDAQQAKHIKFWSTVASNAISGLEPKDVALTSLKSLQAVLGAPTEISNAAGKDLYEFGRDVAIGTPTKVVPPRKKLHELAAKQDLPKNPKAITWAQRDLRNEDDYDMTAYKKANPTEPPKGEGEHYTDEFKQPWHPTFSTDSTAHGGEKKGGKWVTLKDGSDQFQPSAFNLSQFSPDYYENYFKTVETKNASVLLPDGRVIKGTK